MNIIETLEKEQMEQLETKRRIPAFQPGDTVRVSVKVVEGNRERVQAYEGVCIARSGRGFNESFTVRKLSYGEGVERVFPLYSPLIDSITVIRRGRFAGQSSIIFAAFVAKLPESPNARITGPRR